jgi:SAM-dependent methyltransferase
MTADAGEFHCWYSADIAEARKKGHYALSKYRGYLRGRIVDLGCGEGALLLALQESGKSDLLGVESNKELADLAESWGVPVARRDLLEYLRQGSLEAGTYVYMDVVEHVAFEVNIEVMERLPLGSRLVLQTPHTETLRGHEYYFNVPSHVAAYSPFVLRKMLARKGYKIVAEGSIDEKHPPGWKRRVRGILVRKLFDLPEELFLGGGNYFVVADRERMAALAAPDAE